MNVNLYLHERAAFSLHYYDYDYFCNNNRMQHINGIEEDFRFSLSLFRVFFSFLNSNFFVFAETLQSD